jgi:hypothetical protein
MRTTLEMQPSGQSAEQCPGDTSGRLDQDEPDVLPEYSELWSRPKGRRCWRGLGVTFALGGNRRCLRTAKAPVVAVPFAAAGRV